jgi:hypothetical protein
MLIRTPMKSSPVSLSMIFSKKHTDFYSVTLWLKYTCTHYYQNKLGTEKVKGTVEFTTTYFSHSSHYKVSNIRCLSMQYAPIPLQLKYSLINLTKHAMFTRILKKLSSILMRECKYIQQQSRAAGCISQDYGNKRAKQVVFVSLVTVLLTKLFIMGTYASIYWHWTDERIFGT